MTKIFLTTEIPEEQTAASKARIDVCEILKEEGYKTLYLPRKMNVANMRAFWKELSAMAAGETHIVIEYPCWMKRRMYVVYAICKLKSIKLYGIIHDIAAIRFQVSPRPDMAILRLFDGLVSHNSSMTAWLKKQGFNKKVSDLGAFDYRLDHPGSFHENMVSHPLKIFYAGNLSYKKATYIYDRHLNGLKEVKLCVYGQEFDKERMNGSPVQYKGVFNSGAPDLPENYHFGLIWEGNSTDTCNGLMGEYIRFNNPHKFSLYLSLGLPVIVWKEAAIAQFVEDNQIGFTISSFSDLEHLSSRITEENYQQYIQNTDQLARKVRNGFFLKRALSELVNS